MSRLSGLLFTLTWLTGCPTPVPLPCDVDPVGCKSYSSVPITCQREGSLEVQVGAGESGFTAIDDSHGFAIYHGVQGGQHTFAALRVLNPALDHPQLAIEFEIRDGSGEPIGSRTLVLGPPLPTVDLPGYASPVVEQGGIAVFGSLLTTGQQIRVTVKDPCGRQGSATAPFHP